MKNETNYRIRLILTYVITLGAVTFCFMQLSLLLNGNNESIFYMIFSIAVGLFGIYHYNKIVKKEIYTRYEILYNSDGTFCAKEKESGFYVYDNVTEDGFSIGQSVVPFYYKTLEKAQTGCDIHNYTFPVKPAVTDSKNYNPS